MSTNALISYYEHDRVQSVYIHWDGNPEETGKNLVKFFPTKQDAKALVQGGDMSAICNKTGKITYYSEFPGQKILEQDYDVMQDAQDYKEVAPVEYKGIEHFGEVMLCNKSDGRPWYPETYMANIAYLYVHMKGAWHVSDNGIDWEEVDWDEVIFAKGEQNGIWSEFAEQGLEEVA